MRMTRSVALLAVVAIAGPACATKKYVNNEVGEVNRKADALSGDMERTQERVKRTEVRIDEVNADLQTGKATAADALRKADEARQAARGKLIYTVTLSDDQVKFPFDKAALSDEAKSRVSEALAPIMTANQGVYFEIEGHTDSVGPEAYNMRLGEMRALAVRDYLHDHLGIALSRLEVVSYGESKPVTANKTREERAENRRVVVKVLE